MMLLRGSKNVCKYLCFMQRQNVIWLQNNPIRLDEVKIKNLYKEILEV